MADSNTIYMDYQKAMAQARALRDESVRLKNLANNELDGTVSNLRSNWSGSAAEAYLQKCNTLKGNMLNSSQQLERLAQSIEQAAKEAKAADEKAAAIARNIRNVINRLTSGH